MRVGIDIGGTFTDLVAATPGGIVVHKVSSTPADPSQAFLAALGRLSTDVDEIRHGTTVATNAVLTRTGAEIGSITTHGFRHLLHLARQDRPSLYDLHIRRAQPVVDVERCLGVRERIAAGGEVLEPLDEASVRTALEALRGVDGVAVTLLHSYADPSHERRIGELAREILGDVSVSLSCEVLPEFREYERASTTSLNGYVQPVIERYLGRIATEVGPRVGVMWSGGGVRGIDRTVAQPVHTMFSGPAAGVLGATWACTACGFDDVITLDMGGTSADIALVDAGRPEITHASSIDGLPFGTPSLDVISVGAGGGSVAWVDDGGALRVGPASAGADPGPAAYGRGGELPTVTDAQVVLGYLGDEGLAGGELRLDVHAAVGAVTAVGREAGLDAPAAAEGILRVVRATMARAVRSVSVERGKDVRRYALAAFGGAGPLHATALARELGMSRVIVPPAPGALAALGLLVASARADASVSRPMAAEPEADAELRAILGELRAKVLADLGEEGIAQRDADVTHHVDLRYRGQSHELRVPVGAAASFEPIVAAFHRAHAERYASERPSVPVECVTFRATALGPRADVVVAAPPTGGAAEPVSSRVVAGEDVGVFARSTLPLGSRLHGPAIVTELDSTTWLEPGCVAEVHPNGALVIEVDV